MRWTGLLDSIFLCLLVALSVVLYVGYLGFYSDDWNFLEILTFTPDQSLAGLVNSLYRQSAVVWMRPVQVLELAILYRLFGLNPLGYHLVNSAVLMSGILLFYWVLRELRVDRRLALGVAAVYATLPHYSTDRVWMAAFAATLSMTLCLASLCCDLKAVRAERNALWIWKGLALLALAGSVLAYEVFLPLLCLSPFILLYQRDQWNSDRRVGRQPFTWLVGACSHWLVIGAIVFFKLQNTDRVGGFGTRFVDFVNQAGYVFYWTLKSGYGKYGLALPRTIFRVVFRYPNVPLLVIIVLTAAIVFGYLHYVAGRDDAKPPERSRLTALILAGMVVQFAGYAIFLTNGQVGFTPSGMLNRTAIAAAMGVACVFVGAAGLLSSVLPMRSMHRGAFPFAIALLCGAGVLLTNTVASFWVTAYGEHQKLVSEIRAHLPRPPHQSTLLVDGICRYTGPGVVLESDWEATGALRLLYRTPDVTADVVKPGLAVRNDGISIPMYGVDVHHPYDRLFAYQARDGSLHALTGPDAARQYFARFNPAEGNGCPAGQEGIGVEIF